MFIQVRCDGNEERVTDNDNIFLAKNKLPKKLTALMKVKDLKQHV